MNQTILEMLKGTQETDTPDFLRWIADRLVHIYGEKHNIDFILSLRERADNIEKAIELLEENIND